MPPPPQRPNPLPTPPTKHAPDAQAALDRHAQERDLTPPLTDQERADITTYMLQLAPAVDDPDTNWRRLAEQALQLVRPS